MMRLDFLFVDLSSIPKLNTPQFYSVTFKLEKEGNACTTIWNMSQKKVISNNSPV